MPNEKELLKRLKKGDIVAFDKIYNKYNKQLYGVAIQLVKVEQDAEDIIQDVFTKIWQNRHEIREDNISFKSYLFTIAFNSTISAIRKKAVKQDYAKALKKQQSLLIMDDVHLKLEFDELNEKLKHAIDKLSQRQKDIYILSREKGLTYSQIAENLGISVNTVENHMVKTLKLLRSNITSSLSIITLLATIFLFNYA